MAELESDAIHGPAGLQSSQITPQKKSYEGKKNSEIESFVQLLFDLFAEFRGCHREHATDYD